MDTHAADIVRESKLDRPASPLTGEAVDDLQPLVPLQPEEVVIPPNSSSLSLTSGPCTNRNALRHIKLRLLV